MSNMQLTVLAVKNVVRAGTRTTLCVLAICIGITSITLIMTLGNTAGERIQSEIDQIGLQGVAVYTKTGEPFSETALQVFSQMESIQAYMPFSLDSGSVRIRNLTANVGVIGIDHRLSEVFRLNVLYGTLPTRSQILNREKVVVIDADLAQKAYKRKNVVGKQLWLSVNGVSEKMEICGVIESQSAGVNALFGSEMLNLLYMPYTTLNNLSNTSSINKILMLPFSQEIEEVSLELVEQLQRSTGLQYCYENMNKYLDSLTGISDIMTALIAGVAGISVIVGGLGVMNAMFASVDTRTKEIGIYRALGAKRRDIVRTFLLESLILCMMGGMAGISISWIITFLANQLLKITIVMRVKGILFSVGVTVLCGLCVGWIPAMRAAALDPIQAIREE